MMDRKSAFGCLVRRKRVDTATRTRQRLSTQQLARKLSLFDVTAIGVGATIGAGVYILVETVAREHTGPSLTISFFIGGIAAALSAFCYAELACRCPSAGSAYHYSYICIGEGVAWLIGWALILEYTLGGAAVARGVAPNLVKNPQRDMPLGIGIALSICGILYMLVSAVIVGLVPYYALDPDTPISSAFAGYGMEWAVYIITVGAVTALCASLIGAIIPQPRILMAMARNGLLPSFFSDISKHTQVPVKGTIATGIFIAILAFFMDVSQLAGMVSVGTLLSFTVVALSILILRYVPPDELPILLSDQQSNVSGQYLDALGEDVVERPLLQKDIAQDKLRTRKIAAWSITMVCFGILVVVAAVSTEGLSSILRFILCGIGGMLVICCLAVLSSIDQADTKKSFTKSGGFICPFVPFLPVASVLINTYLLVNIGAETWIRVLIWLAVGVIIYIFYGRGHSLLLDDVRRPINRTDNGHVGATLS
ncbi:cationic amino acid transporter 4, vacuolar-like isoform X6 [Lycium ferocissimum]|uniref:cationic amino acid transporter 4, vacuolar-like isoform X6 n=1 Tax=Lycium ferocissimum TaxID=112874 RepID=UPI0028166027|nr:cationic amino acid transporter 4, vacuolar-like isoform X6 [Lycium ferocissimum]